MQKLVAAAFVGCSIALAAACGSSVDATSGAAGTAATTGTGTATAAPGIVTRQPENVIFTRVQLSF